MSRACPTPLPAALLILALATPDVHPQTAPAPATDPALILSPFVVEAGDADGYSASSTLAGTRVKTSLRDLATSVGVVTAEFLQDTASRNALDLLVYTAGTEVPGIGGNFAAPGGFSVNALEDQAYKNPIGSTRLRGLSAADLTRDFFPTDVGFDAYNTERVEINRGANSVLFGLGSPSGIINSATVKPVFKNRGTVQFRGGSHGSKRGSLDLERVLLDRKLAVRIATLAENHRYQTRPAFEDTHRQYGIAEYRPFASTTIRVAGELGAIDANRPRALPPQDSVSGWFRVSPIGGTKLTHDPTAGVGFAALPDGNRLDFFVQQIAAFDTPTLVYAGPAQGTVDPALNSGGVAGHMVTVPRVVFANFPTFGTVAGSATLLRAYGLPADESGYYTQDVVQDTGLFDFRHRLIDGPNKSEKQKFQIADFSLEQQFFQGRAGLKYAYHREYSRFEDYDLFGAGGPSFQLGIDLNTKMTNGEPNVNFGRPFISHTGGTTSRRWVDHEAHQLTAFAETTLARRAGWLGPLLGRQVYTGLLESSSRDGKTLTRKANAWSPRLAALQANRNNTGIVTNRARDVGGIVYLGGSLASASSPSAAGASNVLVPLVIEPQYTVNVYNVATARFENQTLEVERDIPTGGSLARREIDTRAVVLQNYFWDGAVVGMIGWRNDRLENYTSSPPPRAADNRVILDERFALNPTPQRRGETDTLSWSAVGHAPARWLRRLPGAPTLSVHYGVSENTQLGGARADIFGRSIAAPSGETTEKGFTVTLLENRFSLRANWYDTLQARQSVSQFSDLSRNYVVREANFIAQAADLIAANPFRQANIQHLRDYPELPAEILQAWQVQDVAPGLRNVTPPAGLVSTTDLRSKGLELEATWNVSPRWRLLVNASRQEVTRQNTAPDYRAYVASRAAALQEFGAFPASTTGSDSLRTLLTSQSIAGAQTIIRQDGSAIADEIRRWRANLVTNFRFQESSFLGGWNVGGAARWQDRIAIGFPIVRDPTLGVVPDVSRPYYGPSEVNYDGWLGYRFNLGHAQWRLQLNVRNLLGRDDLIPVRANPDGSVPVIRFPADRSWELTSTFSF